MKWLEVIELRSIGSNLKLFESQLETLINEVHTETKNEAFKFYNHAVLDTDFCIHLFHDSKKSENSGSRLGLHLVTALREFGLVNHSIWIEKHSN